MKRKKRKKRQPSASRGAPVTNMRSSWSRLRSHKGFFDLLKFLYVTGARPAETYGCRADERDEKAGAFRIKAAVVFHG